MNSGINTSDSCIALSLDDSADVIFRLTLPFPDMNPTIISTHIVIMGSFLRQLSPSITTCYAPHFTAFLERTGPCNEEHSTVHQSVRFRQPPLPSPSCSTPYTPCTPHPCPRPIFGYPSPCISSCRLSCSNALPRKFFSRDFLIFCARCCITV
jgi:hypothetical protein